MFWLGFLVKSLSLDVETNLPTKHMLCIVFLMGNWWRLPLLFRRNFSAPLHSEAYSEKDKPFGNGA